MDFAIPLARSLPCIFILLALSACGMKGDLYLPDGEDARPEGAQPVPAGNAVDSDAADASDAESGDEPAAATAGGEPDGEAPTEEGRKTIPRTPDPALSR